MTFSPLPDTAHVGQPVALLRLMAMMLTTAPVVALMAVFLDHTACRGKEQVLVGGPRVVMTAVECSPSDGMTSTMADPRACDCRWELMYLNTDLPLLVKKARSHG